MGRKLRPLVYISEGDRLEKITMDKLEDRSNNLEMLKKGGTIIPKSHIPELLQRRRSDSQPGQPVTMRDGLANKLRQIAAATPECAATLILAADTLRRDEQNNAEMIDVLVRAGYKDIPARIDASVIRRLLGYITPGTY